MTGGRPEAPKITLAPRKVQLRPNVRASHHVTNLRPGTFNAPMATLPAQIDPLTGCPTTNRVQAEPEQTRMTLPCGAGQAPNPTGPRISTQLSPGGQNVVPVSLLPTNQSQQQAKVSQAGALVGKPVASVAPMVRTSIPANTPLTAQTSTPNWLGENTFAQMSPSTAKMKCRNFFSTLIRLASDESDHDANRVKMLIQALIEDTIQPEEFHNQLRIALNTSPQPVLVPFFEKSLPYLRYSLMVEEFQIEGVRAPPSNAFMLISPDTHNGTGTHTGMGPHTLTTRVGLQSFGGPRPPFTQQLPLITPPGQQLRPNLYESHEPLITSPRQQLRPNLYEYYEPPMSSRMSPYFRQMPLETMYFPPYPQSRPTILTFNSGYNFQNRQSNAPYYI